MTAREGVIVELTMSDGLIGCGEIAPLPEFAGSDLSTAITALAQFVGSLRGQTPTAALEMVASALTKRTIPPATACGLEMALLDALGQAQGIPISHMLPHAEPTQLVEMRAHVPVNAVIGAQSQEIAVQQARQAVARGFSCLKLKVGRAAWTDLERVAAVRDAVGPGMQLRLDANASWDYALAREVLTACAPLDVQYVEQPLPAADIDGMRRLRREASVPLAVDEALYDIESARRLLAAQAADVLIIKPQLAGGLRIGRQIVQLAAQSAVQCVVTSTIESGIGVAGALHLVAASPEISLACGLATLDMFVDDLILEELLLADGRLTLPGGLGLGVHLDREALHKFTYARGRL
jgi:o-succinylbenzoate synthase